MSWSDLLNLKDVVVFDPFGVYSSPPDVAAVTAYKAFLTGAIASGTLTVNNVSVTLTPNNRYEWTGTEFKVDALVEGQSFKIPNASKGYDTYQFLSGRLQKTSGDIWIEGRLSNAVPALASMIPGITYYSNTTGGVTGKTWTLSEDGKSRIEGVLKSGQFIIDYLTHNQTFFDGIAFKNVSLPYQTSFICKSDVILYEDDGVTPRQVKREDLFATYSSESGKRPVFPSTAPLTHSCLLANQTDETQRWVYLFSSAANTDFFTWTREPPTRFGEVTTIPGFFTVNVQRGDKAGVYRCYTNAPFVNAIGQEQILAFQNNKANNVKVFWKMDDPGDAAELAARIEANRVAIAALQDQSDPVARAAIAALETALSKLPTEVKESIKAVEDQYKALDSSKASATDLATAQAALTALTATVAALPQSGATPEQLLAVDNKVKVLETAIATIQKASPGDRFESRALQESDIDGTWSRWIRYEPAGDTAIFQIYHWSGVDKEVVTDGPATIPRAMATHATATDRGNGLWANTLPGNVSILYKVAPDANGYGYFYSYIPKDTVKHIRFSAQTTAGVEILNGAGDVGVNQDFWVANPSCTDPSIAKLVWTITYQNDSTVNYTTPVTRP